MYQPLVHQKSTIYICMYMHISHKTACIFIESPMPSKLSLHQLSGLFHFFQGKYCYVPFLLLACLSFFLKKPQNNLFITVLFSFRVPIDTTESFLIHTYCVNWIKWTTLMASLETAVVQELYILFLRITDYKILKLFQLQFSGFSRWRHSIFKCRTSIYHFYLV